MCWSNIPQRIDGYHRRRRFSNSRTKPWSKDGSSYVRSIVIPHRIEYDRILVVSSSRLTKFKQQTLYSSFYTQFMEYFYEIRSDYLDFFQPRMKLNIFPYNERSISRGYESSSLLSLLIPMFSLRIHRYNGYNKDDIVIWRDLSKSRLQSPRDGWHFARQRATMTGNRNDAINVVCSSRRKRVRHVVVVRCTLSRVQ